MIVALVDSASCLSVLWYQDNVVDVDSRAVKEPMYGAFYDFYECWSHYPILPFILIGWGESIEFIIYGRRWCDNSDLHGMVIAPPTGS